MNEGCRVILRSEMMMGTWGLDRESGIMPLAYEKEGGTIKRITMVHASDVQCTLYIYIARHAGKQVGRREGLILSITDRSAGLTDWLGLFLVFFIMGPTDLLIH